MDRDSAERLAGGRVCCCRCGAEEQASRLTQAVAVFNGQQEQMKARSLPLPKALLHRW